jgi:hypothetical protein
LVQRHATTATKRQTWFHVYITTRSALPALLVLVLLLQHHMLLLLSFKRLRQTAASC